MFEKINLFLEIYEGKTIGTEERLRCLRYLEICKMSSDSKLKNYVVRLEKLYKENKYAVENDENWLI
jgi:hypothetical protein